MDAYAPLAGFATEIGRENYVVVSGALAFEAAGVVLSRLAHSQVAAEIEDAHPGT